MVETLKVKNYDRGIFLYPFAIHRDHSSYRTYCNILKDPFVLSLGRGEKSKMQAATYQSRYFTVYNFFAAAKFFLSMSSSHRFRSDDDERE